MAPYEYKTLTSRNLAQLRVVSEFNQNRQGWFNEVCVDYEFWRDQYGDPANTQAALYPFVIPGWRNYRQLSDSVSAYKGDTLNRITRISTQLGRMDRNIDTTSAGYFGDGEDEDLMVNYVDSVFDRTYLFFFIPDQTDTIPSRTPTRFLTGWGSLDELAERLFHFGNNSDPSDLWPMFSAEDSVSPADDNIYLGRWLQGTGTWSGPHYLPEVMNIFVGQLPGYYQSIVDNIDSTWINSPSINMNGYCFFRYGLKGLDSLRVQDAMPNELWYCEEDNPLRIASGTFGNPFTINETKFASLLSSTAYRVFNSGGADCGLLYAKEDLYILPNGLYVLVPVNPPQHEKTLRILISQ